MTEAAITGNVIVQLEFLQVGNTAADFGTSGKFMEVM